ncbi:hypothetical protein SCUCBS95973_003845 [Sporothrix curviconia]|uniref:DUF7735 domain-containing protein n=1 Tax=Sporothrix curviconia TaxID=1260050 RepID=A0ABP0BJ83_9PEZI
MARSLLMAAAAILSLDMAATSVTAATRITAAPASTDIAGALSTLLTTAPPTSTEDTALSSVATLCQSDLLAAIFLKATPSGDFASALSSFGSVLTSQECGGSAAVAAATVTAAPDCMPAPSLWCAFPSVAPSSVLASYTQYVMQAASYFPSGLSPLVTLAADCPQAWYGAKTMFPQGPDDFRTFAMLGECFADVRQGDVTTATATRSKTATATATATATNTTANGTATAGKPGTTTSGADRLAAVSVALSVAVLACSLWASPF